MKHACEIFLIRDVEGPILYAPLRDLSARLNESAVLAVSRFLKHEEALPEDTPVLDVLGEYGFFEPTPLPHAEHINKPVQVTLFPSDGCNMRCRYCYADAGHVHTYLSLEAGKAAIDRVAHNAAELGCSDFIVGFHGNGEPMLGFSMIEQLCTYGEALGETLGVTPKYSVATNGVFGAEKLAYILEHFDGINISFDGLPQIQNRQRPLVGGRDSFPAVDTTLRTLDEAGMHYGIRTTLTEASASYLQEIVEYVIEHYPHCGCLHIEPAWECGRCRQTNEKTPDLQDFIQRFINARNICERHGMELEYSAARITTLADAFCGVSDDSFTVTAEGLVTACFEVPTRDDPRSSLFIYGYFDEDTQQFVYDDEKREALHKYTVYNMPHCADCFCKYHCGGDCIAKVLETDAPESHRGSERCEITRALTIDSISRKLHAAEKVMREQSARVSCAQDPEYVTNTAKRADAAYTAV